MGNCLPHLMSNLALDPLHVTSVEAQTSSFWCGTEVMTGGCQLSYTRAFGDGPRNFEPWSSDVETPELAPPLLTTTPHQREDVSVLDRFNVHRCPTRRVFSGTGIELVTKQATIRYLYHSAIAALSIA
ncbi:uncharacterized protein TNCV_3593041 [Trichonephila clavipes]|nr:uncharacterized protein TNCV_3593041 [Trichonephila clavipes]